MIEPQNSISPSGHPTRTVSDGSRYFFLFAIQTIGAAILFWYAVPLFRQVLLDPGGHVVRPENLVWSFSAIALMQAGYWMRHRLRLPLPQLFRNALVGYIVLFVARMSFVMATAVFGFVFIVRRPEFQIPTSRYFIVIIALFALFCYTQELEHLGRAMIRSDAEQKRGESGIN
jgi:hypothetical protein